MINLYTPERSFQAFKQTIVDCTDTFSQTDAFLMNRETISGNILEEFYIPFDYVNENAKIFVIGITPGITQWASAVEEAQRAIHEGCSDEETLRRAKTTGAFSGDLRSNHRQDDGLHWARRSFEPWLLRRAFWSQGRSCPLDIKLR